MFGPDLASREYSLPASRCSRSRRTRTAGCRPEANARFLNVQAEGHPRGNGGSVLKKTIPSIARRDVTWQSCGSDVPKRPHENKTPILTKISSPFQLSAPGNVSGMCGQLTIAERK